MELAQNLKLKDGIWFTDHNSAISYPEEGNDACFQVEDSSFWFKHRNACIAKVVENYKPEGMFLDVGGGNGFVSSMLASKGTR